MKKNILLKSMLCGIAMMGLSACSDFFEPENNTMLKGDDYIKVCRLSGSRNEDAGYWRQSHLSD